MGRHSAADEDDDAGSASDPGAATTVADEAGTAPRGRHSTPDTDAAEDPDTDTGGTDPSTDQPAVAAAQRPRRAPNGDLHMLRTDRTLRARCAAALVVPFVLYTVVLIVVGRTDLYLIWVWIPTVLAGVLAGSFLDRAARRLHQPPPSES